MRVLIHCNTMFARQEVVGRGCWHWSLLRQSFFFTHLILMALQSPLLMTVIRFYFAFQAQKAWKARKCHLDMWIQWTQTTCICLYSMLTYFVGKFAKFNISWLRGGHPILNVGDLSIEASQRLGLLLDQLRFPTVKSLSNSMIVVLINRYFAILGHMLFHLLCKSLLNQVCC